jgi:hypothetical protein
MRLSIQRKAASCPSRAVQSSAAGLAAKVSCPDRTGRAIYPALNYARLAWLQKQAMDRIYRMNKIKNPE